MRVIDVIYVTTYLFAKAPELGARGFNLSEEQGLPDND
jgi:hypothetical protein